MMFWLCTRRDVDLLDNSASPKTPFLFPLGISQDWQPLLRKTSAMKYVLVSGGNTFDKKATGT